MKKFNGRLPNGDRAYIEGSTYENDVDELMSISKKIKSKLKEDINVSFCDVGAEIQVSVSDKSDCRISIDETLLRDMTNKSEVVEKLVERWKAKTKEDVDFIKSFYEIGNEYGWD